MLRYISLCYFVYFYNCYSVTLALHIYRETGSLMGNEVSMCNWGWSKKGWFKTWWQVMGKVNFLTSSVCFQSTVSAISFPLMSVNRSIHFPQYICLRAGPSLRICHILTALYSEVLHFSTGRLLTNISFRPNRSPLQRIHWDVKPFHKRQPV